ILVADAIVFEASLSFIQAGVPDPEPSWGNVIAAGRQLVMSGGWWATFFPGILITVAVLSLNILAEGMTDAMAAPRAKAAINQSQVAAAIDQLSAPKSVEGTEGNEVVVPLEERLAQLRAVE